MSGGTQHRRLGALFSPVRVGRTTLRNRFVMPGMQRGWCESGAPLPRLAEYYRRRAAAGTALIVSESCAVDHPSATSVPSYAWLTDDTRDAWARCAGAVRGEGAEFLIQLWHEGGVREEKTTGRFAGIPTVSPSGLGGIDHRIGRALDDDDLDDVEAAFVRSAHLAMDLGASGVEIHAAHGFLLDQFLWHETNRRSDRWGGDSVAQRVRFPARVISAVRRAIGPDPILSVRFSQWKESAYDARVVTSPEELRTLVGAFEEAGADVLHVSARRFWTPEWTEHDSDLGFAGWVSRVATVPVIAVGSVGLDIDVMATFAGVPAHATGRSSFDELARRFDRGDFDLVSVGRGQLGDPDWTRKVHADRIDQIAGFDLAAAEAEAEQLDAALRARPSPVAAGAGT